MSARDSADPAGPGNTSAGGLGNGGLGGGFGGGGGGVGSGNSMDQNTGLTTGTRTGNVVSGPAGGNAVGPSSGLPQDPISSFFNTTPVKVAPVPPVVAPPPPTVRPPTLDQLWGPVTDVFHRDPYSYQGVQHPWGTHGGYGVQGVDGGPSWMHSSNNGRGYSFTGPQQSTVNTGGYGAQGYNGSNGGYYKSGGAVRSSLLTAKGISDGLKGALVVNQKGTIVKGTVRNGPIVQVGTGGDVIKRGSIKITWGS